MTAVQWGCLGTAVFKNIFSYQQVDVDMFEVTMLVWQVSMQTFSNDFKHKLIK